jgi:hypothetical protein
MELAKRNKRKEEMIDRADVEGQRSVYVVGPNVKKKGRFEELRAHLQ